MIIPETASKILFRADTIPSALRQLPQWVLWRRVEREGKPTKVPFTPAGTPASVSDPNTWTDFETVLQAYQRGGFDGIGFVLTPETGIVCVDIDHARNGSGWKPEALEIVRRLNTYTEISPSGEGLHIWALGRLPEGRRRRNGVEMYSEGRFITVTGDQLAGTPADLQERTAELAELHRRIFGDGEPASVPTPTAAEPLTLDDDELLQRAMTAQNGEKFRALWDGDISGYPSQSEADLALCRLLAFWTGNDPARIERLFSQSALGQREKWRTRADYRQRTISEALSAPQRTYSPANPKAPAQNTEQNDIRPSKNDNERKETPTNFNWDDLAPALSSIVGAPTDWLLYNLIARKELTILAGVSGAGKTTMALEIAHALSCPGQTALGEHPTAHGVVLWLTYDHGADRLLEKYRDYYGEPAPSIRVADLSKLEHLGMSALTEQNLRLWIEFIKHVSPILIIADGLQDWLRVDDSDKESKVRPAMNALRALIDETGVAVLGLAHPSKMGDLHRVTCLSNSYVYGAKADTVAILTDPDGKPNSEYCELRVVKCRSGERWTATYRKDSGRFYRTQQGRMPTLTEKILDFIADHSPCPRALLASPQTLAQLGISERTLRYKLDALIRIGRIERQTGGYKNREVFYVLAGSPNNTNGRNGFNKHTGGSTTPNEHSPAPTVFNEESSNIQLLPNLPNLPNYTHSSTNTTYENCKKTKFGKFGNIGNVVVGGDNSVRADLSSPAPNPAVVTQDNAADDYGPLPPAVLRWALERLEQAPRTSAWLIYHAPSDHPDVYDLPKLLLERGLVERRGAKLHISQAGLAVLNGRKAADIQQELEL